MSAEADEVRVMLSFGQLLRLKTATEWLTGYYEGASNGRALPTFVHERLGELDTWIEGLSPLTQKGDR